MPRSRWIGLAEIAVFYILVYLVMWPGKNWRPTILIAAIPMLAICIGSGKFHGDTRDRIGLPWANTGRALKLLLPWAAPLIIGLFIVGWSKRHQMEWNAWFAIAGYPVWGFVQEYVLLGFIANRLEDGLPEKKILLPWINGLLFGIIHFPNPVLMVVTFMAGVVFTTVYYRERNLWAPAIMHALVGVGITLAFADVYGIMSVGPGYLKRMGNLP